MLVLGRSLVLTLGIYLSTAHAESALRLKVVADSYVHSSDVARATIALPSADEFDFDGDGVKDQVNAGLTVISGATRKVLFSASLPIVDENRNGIPDSAQDCAGLKQWGFLTPTDWSPVSFAGSKKTSIFVSVMKLSGACPNSRAVGPFQPAQQYLVSAESGAPRMIPLNLSSTGRGSSCVSYLDGALCAVAGYNHDSKIVQVSRSGAVRDVTSALGLGPALSRAIMIGVSFADLNGDGVPDFIGSPQHSSVVVGFSNGALALGTDGSRYNVSTEFGKGEYMSVYSPQLKSGVLTPSAPPCLYIAMELKESPVADFVQCYDRGRRRFVGLELPKVDGYVYTSESWQLAFRPMYPVDPMKPTGSVYPDTGLPKFAIQRVSTRYRNTVRNCEVKKGGNVGNPAGKTGECAPENLPPANVQWDLVQFEE